MDGQGDELLALKASGRDRAEQCAWPQGVCPLVAGRALREVGWVWAHRGCGESRLACKLLPLTEGGAHWEGE